MMSITTALEQRTSVRAFTNQPLEESLLREILDVARWAPSCGNLQPWRVIAVSVFGTPVALFFVLDERMGHGQWAQHLGMFMQ